MISEAMMGVSAFKAALDITKGLKDIDDRTRRNEAVIELQEKILGAQTSQAALVQQVGELEKEVAALKAWDADKQRYKLVELKPGVLAYAPKGAWRTETQRIISAQAATSTDSNRSWYPRRGIRVAVMCSFAMIVAGTVIYTAWPTHNTRISGPNLIAAPEKLYCRWYPSSPSAFPLASAACSLRPTRRSAPQAPRQSSHTDRRCVHSVRARRDPGF